ncbi:hypothetical protein UFOVP1511_13 [uncultured Caudovirales phage]|uniref:Uncharacterized protein n=1 Tax=uncultured Caudovirales phage TaxID=2100421 RepID=A0A6J5RMV2_9CAUD|nr:hypothetical protein UFOVP871_13 [uncultured Caudovirales phage]CAB4194968.1 hypothetical protein UFOVP1280_13 [uncultured Caudovirales phage]CAB4223206.1 hypothetical protein UFOVP1663_13 [uncultured Caudovirales phage]CAB5226704.1 hypothetical protein UFOVP1511_13 [uncultured Caudovirales phage]
MNCEICDAELNTADIRMRAELRGICLLCAEEGEFFGMTLEETTRCVAMIRVVNSEKKMTSFERQLQKDMET